MKIKKLSEGFLEKKFSSSFENVVQIGEDHLQVTTETKIFNINTSAQLKRKIPWRNNQERGEIHLVQSGSGRADNNLYIIPKFQILAFSGPLHFGSWFAKQLYLAYFVF
ncbi:hypothetical protein RDI58_003185 [Solanum bulbocastanum]|uniref:Uncharacterized protein n=1 Tax=Solanum bulbocastanum TaxID=147425 RepID=A0AAN8UET7_SOLBU